jgi:CRP-like cAMP-binding protein
MGSQDIYAVAALAAKNWSAKVDARQFGKEWANVLATLPLFRGVNRRHLRRIAELAKPEWFSGGETIVRRGEAGNAFYVILDGQARVVRRGGPTKTLRIGDFFGEMALLDGRPRSATIRAATETTTLRLSHRGFLKMLEQEPRIAFGIMKELTSRLRQVQDTLSA